MTQTTKAVFVVSLGCAKNLVDTEVMCGTLVSNGFYLAESEEDADICLINTCGFIRDAKKESCESIEWAGEWKAENEGRRVVIAGCMVQRYADSLKKNYPFIDLMIGLDDVGRLPEMINSLESETPLAPRLELPTYLYTHETPRLTLTPPSFGYLKIAEGCDHRCAYCAIPLIRGNQRSRLPESIEEECRQLLDQGALELNFIAQDTSRYGADLSPRHTLASLLKRCDKLPGDFWIRVLYTHPLHLTEELLDLLGSSQHILPYLDIPLQHISTHVLKAMNRGMEGEKIKEMLFNLKSKYPAMTFRTTFMTGFPGETEEDFQELLSFVKEFKFDRLGVFSFSSEEGTPAALIKTGRVPAKVAEARKKLILTTQQKISLEHNRQLIGQKMRVILENRIDRKLWEARSAADAPDVDQVINVTTLTNRPEENYGFAHVKITGASEYGLEAVERKA